MRRFLIFLLIVVTQDILYGMECESSGEPPVISEIMLKDMQPRQLVANFFRAVEYLQEAVKNLPSSTVDRIISAGKNKYPIPWPKNILTLQKTALRFTYYIMVCSSDWQDRRTIQRAIESVIELFSKMGDTAAEKDWQRVFRAREYADKKYKKARNQIQKDRLLDAYDNLKKAEKYGHPRAAYKLGLINYKLARKSGGNEFLCKAERYFIRAWERYGDARALGVLGKLYMKKNPPDCKLARKVYLQAAEQKYKNAYYNLGVIAEHESVEAETINEKIERLQEAEYYYVKAQQQCNDQSLEQLIETRLLIIRVELKQLLGLDQEVSQNGKRI